MIARSSDSTGHWVHIPAPSIFYVSSAMARYQQVCLKQYKVRLRKTRVSKIDRSIVKEISLGVVPHEGVQSECPHPRL